jgi:phage baseplate assembly protein W
LSYSGTPVGGEFNITYGSYSQTLAYNCTTPQLQSALTALLAPVSATAVVTGNPGSWAITFSSNTAASNFGASSTSLYSAIEVRHLYPGGIFVATASFTDFSSPTPNTAAASIMVNVSFSSLATSAAPVVFGPILPADQGFPNKNQWDFNFGQDLAVLVSSIKMLLNTEPGERIALPEYGCALRRKIFDQINDASTASDIQGDIQTAISNWEPRVGINNINVALNPSARSITVQLSLYSKLDQRNFQMEVEVERN